MRRLGGKRQSEVGVAAARRMVMDADAIETGVLAADDECCEVGQGPANRNPESDANTGHSPSLFNSKLWRQSKPAPAHRGSTPSRRDAGGPSRRRECRDDATSPACPRPAT